MRIVTAHGTVPISPRTRMRERGTAPFGRERLWAWLAGVALLCGGGCSGGPSAPPRQHVNAAAAARAAMAQYDTNGDGKLDAEELKQSPPLAAMLATVKAHAPGPRRLAHRRRHRRADHQLAPGRCHRPLGRRGRAPGRSTAGRRDRHPRARTLARPSYCTSTGKTRPPVTPP